VITGSDMADHISGGIGADVITAGAGNDIIKGGFGADDITGGTGNDILMERADVDFTLTDTSLAGLGADVLISIEGAKLAGGTSWNTIDATSFTGSTILSGGRGNDVLTGGSGDDLLRADSGNDTLIGAGGADRLYAGSGDDQLHADDGLGTDWVVGERGSDTCVIDLGDTVWGCETQVG
jgi:Ca2+-binding RTX toxin-like protein